MNFTDAVSVCLRKYVDFTGRASRSEVWWFYLFQFVVLLITGMVSYTLYGLAALALLLPSLSAGARRLHDIGKTGWWLLISLIPLIGWLVALYFLVQPTSPETNQWGPPPGAAGPTGPTAPAAPGEVL